MRYASLIRSLEIAGNVSRENGLIVGLAPQTGKALSGGKSGLSTVVPLL